MSSDSRVARYWRYWPEKEEPLETVFQSVHVSSGVTVLPVRISILTDVSSGTVSVQVMVPKDETCPILMTSEVDVPLFNAANASPENMEKQNANAKNATENRIFGSSTPNRSQISLLFRFFLFIFIKIS
jgi:uncharacterized Zn finger protein